MLEGKTVWLEPEDKEEECQKAIHEAVIVIKDGRIIKNRFGQLAPNDEAEKAIKREVFMRMVCAAIGGQMLDLEDGHAPYHPIDKIDTIADVCADHVGEVFARMKNNGML